MKLSSLSIESYSALPQRERRMVLGAVAVVALLFLFGVMLPLDRNVSHTQQRLSEKRADLSWMRSVAPELAAAAPPVVASGESLLVIIDRSARETNLASALTTEPAGPGSVSVRLQKVSFDALITWLASLAQVYGVSVESASIEKADAEGLANAALVLHMG